MSQPKGRAAPSTVDLHAVLPFFHPPESPLSCHSNRGQHRSPTGMSASPSTSARARKRGAQARGVSLLCLPLAFPGLSKEPSLAPPALPQGNTEEALPSQSSPVLSLSHCGRKAASLYRVQAHKLARRTKEKDSLRARNSQNSLKHTFFLNSTLLVSMVICWSFESLLAVFSIPLKKPNLVFESPLSKGLEAACNIPQNNDSSIHHSLSEDGGGGGHASLLSILTSALKERHHSPSLHARKLRPDRSWGHTAAEKPSHHLNTALSDSETQAFGHRSAPGGPDSYME